jgi:hypothetical protein
METSEQVHEIAGALAKAQGEIKAAAKDRENPFFNSRYATLDSIREACVGPLSSHGVAVLQGVSATPETVTVTTMLVHTSGQWVKEALSLVPRDASPQAAGSAITYARRYGLAAMVGVTAEEDDDGNAAQHTKKLTPAQQFRKPPVVTAPVQEIGKPDRPQTTPEAHETESRALFPTPAEGAERAMLIKDAKRLKVKLKLTDDQSATIGGTYLGETVTLAEAALGDLTKMVNFLRTRAQEPTWEKRNES